MYPGPVNSCPVVVFCPKAGTLRYSATSPTSTTSNRDAAIVSLYMLRSFTGNSIWKMESALVTNTEDSVLIPQLPDTATWRRYDSNLARITDPERLCTIELATRIHE